MTTDDHMRMQCERKKERKEEMMEKVKEGRKERGKGMRNKADIKRNKETKIERK